MGAWCRRETIHDHAAAGDSWRGLADQTELGTVTDGEGKTSSTTMEDGLGGQGGTTTKMGIRGDTKRGEEGEADSMQHRVDESKQRGRSELVCVAECSLHAVGWVI
eukprot:TRINITY_DN3225_c0_g4_i2.p1 TRINITY_DN3225_c0_g4~~TRINITY_DN3225_c0_g4_i2.p1  ORF type:complete len:106 (+),score=2.87 TRINITY_DN3225_c0_g4_i2:133-450(+)